MLTSQGVVYAFENVIQHIWTVDSHVMLPDGTDSFRVSLILQDTVFWKM